MQGEKYLLSLNGTYVLKGVAIMAIILHNFCHWLPDAVIENQHVFHLERNCDLIELLQQGGPNLFLNLVSHYGHYGVPVFVFLSGYGLVRKYEEMQSPVTFWGFMKKHISKLWLLLLPVFIPHFLFLVIKEPGYFEEHIIDFGLMTGFAGNLNPNSHIFQGPWWFFSLIVQLYVIYYVFVYRHSLRPVVILTIGCMIAQIIAIINGGSLDDLEYLRFNFVGSMLPFTLGIAVARKNYFPTNNVSMVAFVLFILCCFNIYSWLLTFGLITIAVLPLVKLIRTDGRIYKILRWTGMISAFIFVSHPIIRSNMFRLSEYSLYPSILGYLILCVLLAWGYQKLLIWLRLHSKRLFRNVETSFHTRFPINRK